jgi:cyclophilin family peptidyl-prolyl cis-trans isomerase
MIECEKVMLKTFRFLILSSTLAIGVSGCATKKEMISEPVAAATPIVINKEEGSSIVKVKIETTLGDIYADLFRDDAPKTVENFLTLTKKNFYDGIIFHRVIPGFMIQTGDPTGTGRGGPGYQFDDEFSENLRHDEAGMLSMANSGPNTNGSQFFITVASTPWLDNRHSIFGKVTQGLDVAEKIVNVPRNRLDKPLEDVKMVNVDVLE